jgi:diacylglycerol kinase (ATP)
MHGTIHLFDQLPVAPLPAGAVEGCRLAPVRPVPLVGVIRNQRSHRNAGGALPAISGAATLLVEAPTKRSDLLDILRRFAEARIDYLVVDGGDGTVRDVLTCGTAVFGGGAWPRLILLPAGKTNALAADLSLPADWSLDRALALAVAGKGVVRRPLLVAEADNPQARVAGFALGAGLYTQAIALGQRAHRHGAFNSVVVVVTALWTVLQALFGSAGNPFRRPTPMRLADSAGRALPHAPGVREGERFMLFASTLTRFPGGVRPFRRLGGTLRLAIVDRARAGVLLRIPLAMAGLLGGGSPRRGYHLLGGQDFALELGEQFILDGEAFPPGKYRLGLGPALFFVTP